MNCATPSAVRRAVANRERAAQHQRHTTTGGQSSQSSWFVPTADYRSEAGGADPAESLAGTDQPEDAEAPL
jgi:hypothetical protein